MNNLPRQKLREIVTQRNVVDDPRLCEALLRDLCGEHRREIFVLVAALKERVAADLLASQAGVPHAVVLTRLTQRLQDNLALTEEAARWAVDSWALALGLPASAPESQPRAPQASVPLTVTPPPTPTRQALTLTLAPGVTMDFVRVPAGNFLMGSTDQQAKYDYEKPQHSVYLDEYLMGKYPVMVAQFAAFVKVTQYPCQATLDVKAKANHPVTQVSWDDAAAFCAWAAKQTGQKVRLPTEAEWEKAARGSDGRTYPWGNAEPTDRLCNFNRNVKDTTPVGQYSPQGDSLYFCADMAGNVWEWCADWFAENYYAQSPAKNPPGPAKGQSRVVRGGSWVDGASIVRASYRNRNTPDYRNYNIGFRCVR